MTSDGAPGLIKAVEAVFPKYFLPDRSGVEDTVLVPSNGKLPH